GLGTLLTAAYLLVVVRRVCMGEHPEAEMGGTLTGAPAGTPAGRATGGAGEAAGATGAAGAAGGAGGPGAPAGPLRPALADVRGYEFAAWTPLVALTVLGGLWPAALLGLTDPAVQQLLAGGH
ncbi:NADH-quinone oxidoreductase subunit M, partial [Streptomyces sp. MCAF7]